MCTGGDKLNPFALPHRVFARAGRLELRRTVNVQLSMALHDSRFHMTSDVSHCFWPGQTQACVYIAAGGKWRFGEIIHAIFWNYSDHLAETKDQSVQKGK